jgi:hypothetical protein
VERPGRQNEGDRGARGPGRTKLAVAFATISVAAALGGYLYYRAEAREIRQERSQALSVVGELKAAQIEQWRSQRLIDVQRAASSPFDRAALAEWLAATPAG